MLPNYDIPNRLNLIARMGNGNFMKQHMGEFTWAFHHVAAHIGIPHVFVEVGAMGGASFFLYAGLMTRGGLAIALDDGKRGWRWRRRLRSVVAYLRQHEEIDAHWIQGSSHDQAVRAKVCELIGERKVDFLHIDGDHSAKGSYQDWLDYGQLVRPGGITAFHDIRATKPCHVDETWTRICNEGYLTRAICKGPFRIEAENGKEHKACGIGLVYM